MWERKESIFNIVKKENWYRCDRYDNGISSGNYKLNYSKVQSSQSYVFHNKEWQ